MEYFLHIRVDDVFIEDEEGERFASLADAEREVTRAAQELVINAIQMSQPIDVGQVELHSSTGQLLLIVRFIDVVRFRYRPAEGISN